MLKTLGRAAAYAIASLTLGLALSYCAARSIPPGLILATLRSASHAIAAAGSAHPAHVERQDPSVATARPRPVAVFEASHGRGR